MYVHLWQELGKQVDDTCLCEALFTLVALSHRNTVLATNVQAYLVLLNFTLLQFLQLEVLWQSYINQGDCRHFSHRHR